MQCIVWFFKYIKTFFDLNLHLKWWVEMKWRVVFFFLCNFYKISLLFVCMDLQYFGSYSCSSFIFKKYEFFFYYVLGFTEYIKGVQESKYKKIYCEKWFLLQEFFKLIYSTCKLLTFWNNLLGYKSQITFYNMKLWL